MADRVGSHLLGGNALGRRVVPRLPVGQLENGDVGGAGSGSRRRSAGSSRRCGAASSPSVSARIAPVPSAGTAPTRTPARQGSPHPAGSRLQPVRERALGQAARGTPRPSRGGSPGLRGLPCPGFDFSETGLAAAHAEPENLVVSDTPRAAAKYSARPGVRRAPTQPPPAGPMPGPGRQCFCQQPAIKPGFETVLEALLGTPSRNGNRSAQLTAGKTPGQEPQPDAGADTQLTLRAG